MRWRGVKQSRTVSNGRADARHHLERQGVDSFAVVVIANPKMGLLGANYLGERNQHGQHLL